MQVRARDLQRGRGPALIFAFPAKPRWNERTAQRLILQARRALRGAIESWRGQAKIKA